MFCKSWETRFGLYHFYSSKTSESVFYCQILYDGDKILNPMYFQPRRYFKVSNTRWVPATFAHFFLKWDKMVVASIVFQNLTAAIHKIIAIYLF